MIGRTSIAAICFAPACFNESSSSAISANNSRAGSARPRRASIRFNNCRQGSPGLRANAGPATASPNSAASCAMRSVKHEGTAAVNADMLRRAPNADSRSRSTSNALLRNKANVSAVTCGVTNGWPSRSPPTQLPNARPGSGGGSLENTARQECWKRKSKSSTASGKTVRR